ncbi:hypothetical protein AURDEDRAFT_169928 [Auricularia subglabra TFB-10046 SS5]|uniref:DUF6533 domain-containing protein n=1 Tax=Auricularia subglabra (strain TFB-10046 / SS5) TaxID=717982 RepID=J0DD11_AURST|nr:hypothetical protein AURDEDRAFT_169928 [Auricularia subglabra TFB-10046 SS5]
MGWKIMEGELGQLISQVSTVLRQSEASSYAAASAVAWLTYDIILTIPLEIKHIWRRLTHGYANNLCLTPYLRREWSLPKVIGTQVLAYIVDSLLILHLHSVYGRRRSITIPLLLLYIAQAIIEAVLVAVSTSTTKAIPAPSIMPSWPGCFYDKPPRFVLAAWVPSLILQTILFAMTLYKLWELRVNGIKASGILNVFVRDGAMFFAMIFAATLMNALTAAIAPLPLLEIGGPWLIAIYGIATSRLILNLREYNESSTSNTATASGTQVEQTGIELDFRRPHAGESTSASDRAFSGAARA